MGYEDANHDLLTEILSELRKIATIMAAEEDRRLGAEARSRAVRHETDIVAARLLVRMHNDERKHADDLRLSHLVLAASKLPGDDPDPLSPGCDGGLDLRSRIDKHKRPSTFDQWVWLAGATPPRWEIRGTGARL